MKKTRMIIASLLILGVFGCKRSRTTRIVTTKKTRTTRSNQSTTKDKTVTVTPVENKIIYVSVDGTTTNSGTLEEPTTFLHALDLMNSGDTIYINEGTYVFSDTISITKSGSEVKRNSIIGNNAIFDFSDTKDDDSPDNGGISLSGSYWEINNITVINSGYYGFKVVGANNSVNKENIINGCNANYNDYGGFYVKTSYSLFSNCMSLGNSLPGYFAYGYYIDGNGEKNTFDSCIAKENSDTGFMVRSTKKTVFEKCLSIGNGHDDEIGSSQRGGFIFNNMIMNIMIMNIQKDYYFK